MIRRISKNNDYRDIIKSCPSGVIDDIYSVRYFISGHPETEVEASFTKKGNLLEVILPTSLLIELGNGVLMRRALYMNSDSDFPDGEYNLEFIDDLNVWLGDEEVDAPFDPGGEYLTADDLKTVNHQSLVGEGNIEIDVDLTGYATQSWVESQNYLTTTSLSGYATKSWVESQGYLTAETIPSDIATESYVQSALSGYATESWVDNQGYVSTAWLSNQGYLTVLPYYESMTASRTYAYLSVYNESISSSFYAPRRGLGIFGSEIIDDGGNTISVKRGLWVSPSGYMYSFYDEYGSKLPNLDPIVTETTLISNGYLSTVDLSSYATQSWVESQGYITSTGLSGLATQSWVSSNYAAKDDLSDCVKFVPDNPITLETGMPTLGRENSYNTQDLIIGYDEYNGEYTTVEEMGTDLVRGHYVTIPGGGVAHTHYEYFVTDSWVEEQGYLTSVPSNYATQSWVTSQGYLSAVPSEYATQSWATSQFLEESKIWTGSQSAWDQLTSAQKALYTIALITE